MRPPRRALRSGGTPADGPKGMRSECRTPAGSGLERTECRTPEGSGLERTECRTPEGSGLGRTVSAHGRGCNEGDEPGG
jgi:hypothetical protein